MYLPFQIFVIIGIFKTIRAVLGEVKGFPSVSSLWWREREFLTILVLNRRERSRQNPEETPVRKNSEYPSIYTSPFSEKSTEDIGKFHRIIREFYRDQGRTLPWRQTRDPYQIFVSEFMLQQTQVERVLKKYGTFISVFPDFSSLAHAPLHHIIALWQGLGYNRRCIYMKQSAEAVVQRFGGKLPEVSEQLSALPGIGCTTAAALVTFAYNIPTVFVETNIRRVFIYFFFPDSPAVRDTDIFPVVEKTLDHEDPRQWYYALMDYGVWLKKRFGNINHRSKSYKKQPAFAGSDRQIRGNVLKTLVAEPGLSGYKIAKRLSENNRRVQKILSCLREEGFLKLEDGVYSLEE